MTVGVVLVLFLTAAILFGIDVVLGLVGKASGRWRGLSPLTAHRGVGRHVGRRAAIGRVELAAQHCQLDGGIKGMIQGATDAWPCRFPHSALQEPDPGVGPLLSRRDEEIVTPERRLGLLEHRASVRFAVDQVAGAGAAYAVAPRGGDGGQRRVAHRWWPGPLQRRQEVEGLEQRARPGDTAEAERAQQRRQKTAHRRILMQASCW